MLEISPAFDSRKSTANLGTDEMDRLFTFHVHVDDNFQQT